MHPACVFLQRVDGRRYPRRVYKTCGQDCGCRVESRNSYTRSSIAAALNQPPPRALWSCGPGICSGNSNTTERTTRISKSTPKRRLNLYDARGYLDCILSAPVGGGPVVSDFGVYGLEHETFSLHFLLATFYTQALLFSVSVPYEVKPLQVDQSSAGSWGTRCRSNKPPAI